MSRADAPDGSSRLAADSPSAGRVNSAGFLTGSVTGLSNSNIGGPQLDLESRLREYAICRERGHSASHGITAGYSPTVYTCKYCGTEFWAEVVEHERGAPEDPIGDPGSGLAWHRFIGEPEGRCDVCGASKESHA